MEQLTARSRLNTNALLLLLVGQLPDLSGLTLHKFADGRLTRLDWSDSYPR